MTPQVVDLNGDKLNDLIIATFEGTAFLLEGTDKGFKAPQHVKDSAGENVRIAMYWDLEEKKYSEVDRTTEDEEYRSGHHMTSIATVDWDQDGDFDLILGAYEGGVYRCMNEGTATEPKFSAKNLEVQVDGELMMEGTGLTAPRVCDWNGDGKFDILCGGVGGGVFMYPNVGEKGAPEFGDQQVLIKPNGSGPYVKEYPPLKDGLPAHPMSNWHIEPVDYDGDGHLDLLVGGRAFIEAKTRELSDEEQAEVKQLREAQQKFFTTLNELYEAVDRDDEDEMSKLTKSEEYKALMAENRKARKRLAELSPQSKQAELVWLYRNTGRDSKSVSSDE